MIDGKVLTISDLYEKGKPHGTDGGIPTALDLLVDRDSCPDRITLTATMMFTLTVVEQFRKDGCDEDEATRMTEDFLANAPSNEDIADLWRRVGLAFVAKIRENGGRETTINLIHEATPLDEE